MPEFRDPSPVSDLYERGFLVETTCGVCGGRVIIVGERRWCVRPFAEFGCGRFWTAKPSPEPAQRPLL
jgi:hypothetical protein